MNKQIDAAMEEGLDLMKPLMANYVDTIVAMKTINKVQTHYRNELTRAWRVCPVCEDSACEIKSVLCGT